MTVFVDDMQMQASVGRLSARWSHMLAGPYDPIDELHALADAIGLKRSWFQGPPGHSWPRQHYDLTESKRQQAIRAGAVPVSVREMGAMMVSAQRRRNSRILFADWHGVLCTDPFWSSVRCNTRHPAHARVAAAAARAFDPAAGIVRDWMTGELSSAQVIARMDVEHDGRYGDDFLLRTLDADCLRMQVRTDLLSLLEPMEPYASVVIATDNADCLVRAWKQARSRKGQGRAGTTLAGCAPMFRDLICSSETGVLKSEDAQAFYGPWLTARGLSFTDAVLIDDRADNCAAFTAQGGTAIQWQAGNDTTELSACLEGMRQHDNRDHHRDSGLSLAGRQRTGRVPGQEGDTTNGEIHDRQ